MDIDIKKLFDDELMMLNWLVGEFEIPADIFLECGASYLVIAANNLHHEDRVPIELMKEAKANFERLCQSAPHIPRHAMESLSLAYGAFAFLTRNGTDVCNEDGGSAQSHMQALFAVTMARGVAMGNAGMRAGEIQAMSNDFLRKKSLSEAGAKGALVKLQPYGLLKTWALAQAVGMRDQDIDIARRLSAQIPEHLADVSKNPERLIYDALRAQRTPD